MAANQITIDTSAINAAKNVIKSKNQDLNTTLNNIYRAIEDLIPSHWSGDAATKTQEKMLDFKSKTQTSYNQVLNEYISFIENTVNTYEANETNTSNNATSKMDSSAVAQFD